MKPCSFYMNDSCKFSDEKCKFSHGELVDFNELRDFKEPDYSRIKGNVEGTRILVLDGESGLWKNASLIQYEDHDKVHIRFNQEEIVTVSLDCVLPTGNSDNDSSEEEEFAPVELALSRGLVNPLGDWESYTKGIGSKIMAAMGYVVGTGLGKDGEGRVEPVPVMVYPSGKSLDWCMEAKSQNLDSAPKGVVYLDKKRKLQEAQKERQQQPKQEEMNVFDIINTKLGSKSEPKEGLELSKVLRKGPSSSRSSNIEDRKALNVENFKTMEKLRQNQQQIDKVEASLKRSNDKASKSILSQKLNRLKSQREELQTHEKNVESSLSKRSKKKLEIF